MDEAQYPDLSSDWPEWNPDQKPRWIRLLDQIATDCRTEGWDDNYAVVPVTAEAITAARLLCSAMIVVPHAQDGGIQVSFLGESISIDIDGQGTVTGVYLFRWMQPSRSDPETPLPDSFDDMSDTVDVVVGMDDGREVVYQVRRESQAETISFEQPTALDYFEEGPEHEVPRRPDLFSGPVRRVRRRGAPIDPPCASGPLIGL
jgi:hypothetical protein